MEIIKGLLSPGWVGSLISLAGLIAALIIYRASRIGARPAFQWRAIQLLAKEGRGLPEDLEILFKGRPVGRVTMTHVIFWNSGKALLRGTDIVEGDPLRFEVQQGAEFLQARILKVTRPVNKCFVQLVQDAPTQARLTFDYLDPGDGVVIEFLHTAEKRLPRAHGTIRGVPRGVLDWGSLSVKGSERPILSPGARATRSAVLVLRRPLLIMTAGIGLVVVAAGLLAPNFVLEAIFRREAVPDVSRSRVPLVALGTLYMLPAAFLLWTGRRRFPRALVAEEVES